jgi:hypothetical protein
MTMVDSAPHCVAAKATPCAWLPALAATNSSTPRSTSWTILLYAPRVLNDPVHWRCSSFRCTSASIRLPSDVLCSTGVGFATSSTSRSRARSMAA